jgi:murein DD-endopeptidase MepM/ murein hydrolase activator NlpD
MNHRPTQLPLLILALAAGSAFAEGSEPQTVHIAVPSEAAPVGGEYLLPADPDDDRRRSIRLSRTPVYAAPVPRVNGTGLMLRNRLHAPVTVEMTVTGTHNAVLRNQPPERLTLAPLESREITMVRGIDITLVGSADFRYQATVGLPDARPNRDHIYAWPLAESRRSKITQSFAGPTHNEPFSQFAIDIAAPEGTPVVAARAGVVIFLEDRYFESGMDREEFRDKANHVRVLHDDGSMATYAHLAPESVSLVPGQRVQVGDEIGRSGNTGYSSGPHLHFAILVNRDMDIVSIPFRMDGVRLPNIGD